ncbi:class I SAM-dependent methyltransferase [Thiobacter aerophilum]|uniref:Class I SAM-dependent methyltransferase n=1 Tax=Thiobacter aerophilum TaxID=3121275 RepID=A0ABV0EEX3_9BURK
MLQSQMIKLVESRLRRHNLPVALELWNGQAFKLVDEPAVKVRINRPNALLHLANPSLGKLAKSYVERDIDLTGTTRDIIRLGESLCDGVVCGDKKGSRFLSWWRHSKPADRKNISYHYDVSNDFYGLWLDARRVYSCAYFRTPDDTLDVAQEQKLEHICRKLHLKPGERFLDIGCGWGGLILWAAERHGVRAAGITLSQNQYEYVRQQIRARGLDGQVEVHLMDYRDVPETEPFDKIASVGMFEHVGRANLGKYFAKIQRLLKPGGLVMNHGITAASRASGGLGSGISEFIDEYVFPGGELVHVSEVIDSLSAQGLECWDAECLRPHYARTLWHWVERLEAHAAEAKRLVGEEKFRIWQIYMAGSAHAFERGWMSLFQILAGKPLADGRLPYPLTREHVYA